MSQQRKSVRVVIVNWRTPLLTERAARSLWPQLRAGDELVVVDNASASADPHDNSLAHLRRLGAKPGSACLLYTFPSPRARQKHPMPSFA